ncbi:hypothetical protein [Kocuria sp. CH-021]|uniref:hypothetical protein n=1 Tax=Kocuria sp. CH-021 TaxID=3406735 RepID=UPI003C73D486
MAKPLRRGPAARVLTEGERESSLSAADWFNGTRMAEGRTDRAGALKHMRETIGGFPPERYETQLDAALACCDALIDEGIRRRRHPQGPRVLDPRAEHGPAAGRSSRFP